MRVLITGAHGQVGQELLRLAPKYVEVLGFGSSDLDITCNDIVQSKVSLLQPNLIINAAAYTAVDKAESEPMLAYGVNEAGVRNLAMAATTAGIPVLHISTDYVFDGASQSEYSELDITRPTGVYGASKLAGERALSECCERYINLRTSWVFGQYGHNFVKTMLRLANERDTLGVVSDQKGCPTGAASIARALWAIAQQCLNGGRVKWGTYHYSGSQVTTWYEFAITIFELAQQQGLIEHLPTVNPIATSDYPTPANRPANSVLCCDLIHKELGIVQPDWHQDLKDMLGAL